MALEMKLLSADVIRRCLIADPGMHIFTADYDQIELRIIAALANETKMIEAAKRGESLHLTAANQLFGVDHLPDQYKLAKNINFTWAFGGTPRTMHERYEITMAQAIKVHRDYEEGFPSLAKWKRRQQEQVLRTALSPREYKVYKSLLSKMFSFRTDTAEGKRARDSIRSEMDRLTRGKVGYITTAFGRRLPVSAGKPYTAVNYEVQCTAADVMKHGLLRVMDDPELEPTVLLVVHDELLGQGEKAKAEYLADRYAEVMTTEFKGVPITASGKVYGKSWGHGYRKAA